MATKRNESKKCRQGYVQFPVIMNALNGDADAMKSVTSFYDNYIRSFCYRCDEGDYGEGTHHFDEVLYQILKSKLIESVLLKFTL